ncbi:MAG: methyltransferase domain-containing protein [Proteobacteria bacterium]|nr:methyltransferase domain-containing protein [Pseudomonadota bacterium]MBU1419477.1 methyltransferase domain-containing protein [Pseudomonadota bacterium]MBU1455168.1 methyltransferase domain-containing protein [Pseudomonadota bacterium]
MSHNKNSIDEKTLHTFVASYLSSRPAFYAFIRPQEAYILNQNIQVAQRPILDFGCGDGFFANEAFAEQVVDVGLDVDNSRIHQAKTLKTYQRLNTYEGEEFPFTSNTFSTIFANSVLEHISNLDNSLDEIFRVLTPGGLFMTSVMADKWEQYLPIGKLLGKRYLRFLRKKQEHRNLFSHRQWQEVFEKHGFEILSVVGYLNKRTVNYLEICHYLSVPSLASYKLSGRWVPFPNWHKPMHLSKKITSIIKHDINSPVSESSALFFIMKKLP